MRARMQVFVVQAIVDAKTVGARQLFRVRWAGFTPEDDTWEPRASFSDSLLVDNFLQSRTAQTSRGRRSSKPWDTHKQVGRSAKQAPAQVSRPVFSALDGRIVKHSRTPDTQAQLQKREGGSACVGTVSTRAATAAAAAVMRGRARPPIKRKRTP